MAKNKLPNDKVRKQFYEAGDGIYGLVDTIKEQMPNDEESKKLIKEIKDKYNELRQHLDNNYLWD